MRNLSLTALLCLLVVAAPISAQTLNEKLNTAVAGENWSEALTIVDQMLATASGDRKEKLEEYRLQLVKMAGEEVTTDENLAKLVPYRARGEVASFRREQFSEDVRFYYPDGRLARIDQDITDTYMPETYKVVVQLKGPVGIGTQTARVRATLMGGGEETLESTIEYGTQGIGQVEYTFSSAEVKAPSSVLVEVVGGQEGTLDIKLPGRDSAIILD